MNLRRTLTTNMQDGKTLTFIVTVEDRIILLNLNAQDRLSARSVEPK